MTTIVVTSVGAIASLALGAATVTSSVSLSSLDGIDSAKFGQSIVKPNRSGASVLLDLADAAHNDLNLHLGSAAKVARPSGVHADPPSPPVIYNLTTVAQPSGLDSFVAPRPFARYDYGFLTFDLTETPRNQHQIGLFWGAGVVMTKGSDTVGFGTEATVVKPDQIDVSGYGLDTLAIPSGHRLYDGGASGGLIEFDFTGVYQPGPRLRLDFTDGDRPISMSGVAPPQFAYGSPAVDLAAQGASPTGIAPARVPVPAVGDAAVFKPLVFHFMTREVPPDAHNIGFYWSDGLAVRPWPFETLAFGDFQVIGTTTYATVYGFRGTTWGLALVEHGPGDSLWAESWISLKVGEPTVANSRAVINLFHPPGYSYSRFGTPAVVTRFNQRLQTQGAEHPEYGDETLVAWQTRWVYTSGFRSPAVGDAAVGYRVRYVDVPWTSFWSPGRPAVVRHIEITLPGTLTLRIGDPSVAHGNVALMQGASHTATGRAWISRSPRTVAVRYPPVGPAVGTSVVYNSDQYIRPTNPQEPMPWGGVGDRSWVYNGDRTIAAYGINSLRMTFQFDGVYLAGRAALITGLPSAVFGKPYVDFSIRSVVPSGLASLRVPYLGTRLHNAARVLAPAGVYDAGIGRPAVVATRRWVRQYHGPVAGYGTPFVAPAVRTLVQKPFTRSLTTYGMPLIGYLEAEVGPESVPPAGFGLVTVTGPFLRGFTPHWIRRDTLGIPRVQNYFKDLYPRGLSHLEVGGQPWVSRSPRYLVPPGFSAFAVYKPVIKDRRLWIDPTGVQVTQHGYPTVRKLVEDPPTTPTVDFEDAQFDALRVGVPSVGANSVYPDGIDSWSPGNGDVRAQHAEFRSFAPFTLFGIPKILDTPQTAAMQGLASMSIPWQRVTPHTVYMTADVPQQAVVNHPESMTFSPPAGYGGCLGSNWPAFGCVRVANQYRGVTVYSGTSPHAVFGTPRLALTKQYAQVSGVLLARYGFPILIPHTRKLRPIGLGSLTFGDLEVRNARPDESLPFDQTAAPTGWSSLGLGTWRIELFNRRVYPDGILDTIWGNNYPMVYHYPRGPTMTGRDQTVWGTAWAATDPRYLAPEGLDSFASDWDTYIKRMVVRGGWASGLGGVDGLLVDHVTPPDLGTPTVSPGQRRVAVYMIPPICIRPFSVESQT